MIKIAPSILAADFSRMGEEVKTVRDAGAEWLHLDIMDGHFVDNLTFGPAMAAAVNNSVDLFLDVHLMVTNPEKHFKSFSEAGANLLTFHIEIAPDPDENIEKIRGLGCQVGISLNPDKPVESVLPHLHKVDLVLLMSVFPGFGGQGFIPESITRAAQISEYIRNNNLSCELEIDGGVNRTTGPQLIEAGADILVMGTAFFRDDNQRELVQVLKSYNT